MDNEPVFHEVFSDFLARAEVSKLASEGNYTEVLRRQPNLGLDFIRSLSTLWRQHGYREPWQMALKLVSYHYPNLEVRCNCLACIDVCDRWV